MSLTPDSKAEWLERVLGITIGSARGGPATAAAPAGPVRNGPAGKGMAAWQAARGTALATLKSLENAFRATDDPEVDAAIILLRAVQANLTAAPATPAQVAELERYITTDDVVEEAEVPNGFGITVELRTPLLAALASLRADQAEAGGTRP